MAEYRLQEQKYTEAEYRFKTIEMAKSDEEYDIELCGGSPPPTASEISDLELMHDTSIYSLKRDKVYKHSSQSYRYRKGENASPPAPPSTPTSLTACGALTPSPTAATATATAGAHSNGAAEEKHRHSLLYIFDLATKYKKKLKDQQRTDAELAELFNVVTITGGVGRGCGSGGIGGGGSGSGNSSDSKLTPERGISESSRVIRKQDGITKTFRIHRNPKEFFRDRSEEDSVSAPEYDDAEDDERCYRFLSRLSFNPSRLSLKTSRRLWQTRRQRRFARFEHSLRMEAMVDNFDAAMNFNEDNGTTDPAA